MRPVPQDRHALTYRFHFGQYVRREQHRSAFGLDFSNHAGDGLADVGVQAGRRFVKDQHVRVSGKGRGQRQFLPHAGRHERDASAEIKLQSLGHLRPPWRLRWISSQIGDETQKWQGLQIVETAVHRPAGRPRSDERPAHNAAVSRPRIRAQPRLGRKNPKSKRSRVVFPAPLGPSRPKTSPASMDRSQSSNAVTSPYRFVSRHVWMAGTDGIRE